MTMVTMMMRSNCPQCNKPTACADVTTVVVVALCHLQNKQTNHG